MGIGNIEWYEKAVMAIDSALNKWMDSVPEHRQCILHLFSYIDNQLIFSPFFPVQWDKQHENQDIVFLTQSTVLYSLYYWVQIEVHRRFIPRPRNSSGILSFPSLAICTNAARSCLRVCELYMKRAVQYYSHFLVSFRCIFFFQ
jgi:hypothetical protein